MIAFAVTFSFVFNLLVIIVLVLRPQKKSSTDIFIIALATSDMLFAIAIHPMLIATSFGANAELLFSSAGKYLTRFRGKVRHFGWTNGQTKIQVYNFSFVQAQLGVPHSRIQVELGFILQAGTSQILNFAQNPRQSQRV